METKFIILVISIVILKLLYYTLKIFCENYLKIVITFTYLILFRF